MAGSSSAEGPAIFVFDGDARLFTSPEVCKTLRKTKAISPYEMSAKDIAQLGGAMFERRLALTAALSALALVGNGSAVEPDAFTSRIATAQLSSKRNDKD
jgi:hypothetical protein